MTIHDQHYRPLYHFSAPANWLNDPNGLVYYQGEYHLFYQYHPHSSVWGPMYWGHAVSPDLIHWQHLPIALYPDEFGMIYSGSAVIDWQNTAGFGKEAMVVIFTHHQNGDQGQSLAYSTDRGRTWTKYPGNPVLLRPDDLSDFRDPKVFWYGENGEGHWVMTLAAGDSVHFYTSPNLRDWTATGRFGVDHGAQGGVWETPDLFKMTVEQGSETRWVLTVGVGKGGPGGGSGNQYFVGQFDGETFLSENPKDTVLWVDFGADYYAAQSWSDEPKGRRLMVGWQNNWQYAKVIPTTTWRGVFSIPRELSLKQTRNGIRLFQHPIPEFSTLRRSHSHWVHVTITPGSNLLNRLTGDSVEIAADFQINSSINCFGFRLRVGSQEQTTVGYNVQQQALFLDRTNSGQSNFDAGFARVHSAKMAPVDGIIRLRLFLDRSSLEVFGNNGEVVISDSIFPEEQSQGLELFTQGGKIILNSLDVFELNPVNFTMMEKYDQNLE
jgi:fructan beta-fructosidase